MKKTRKQLLMEANDLIRSFHAVIERKGESTNWEALKNKTTQVLADQHVVLASEYAKINSK